MMMESLLFFDLGGEGATVAASRSIGHAIVAAACERVATRRHRFTQPFYHVSRLFCWTRISGCSADLL